MKKFLSIVALVGSLVSAFANDDWQDFSVPFPIRDIARNGDDLVLATDGGIRFKGPDIDVVYTSESGLETSAFYVVIEANGKLYAISENGLVARYEGTKWKVVNRSYLSRNSRVIPSKAMSASKYIAILFEDGLAFFDTESGTSLLHVNQVGNVSLSVYPPEDIAIRNDSLFVSTIHGVYARKMDWSDLSRDFRLVDPASWTLVDTDIFMKDSLHIYADGKEFTDSVLFKEGKSRIKWISEGKNYTYLVGDDAIFWNKKGTLMDVTKYLGYTLGSVYEIQMIPGGGIVAVSPEGFGAISKGTYWSDILEFFFGYGSYSEAFSKRMKVMSVLDDDMMLYHVWGQGMRLMKGLGTLAHRYIAPSDGTCMDQYFDNFTVAAGTTVAPDKSGFLAATANSGGKYSLIYITKDGDISCATAVGSSPFAGPLVAKQEGSDWIVYVSSRTTSEAFSAGALDVFRFPSPSANGGRIVDVKVKTLPNIEKRTPLDLALDEKHNVLWMASMTDVSYMELDSDTIRKPNSTNGLSGAEFSAIDVDPHGNVWLGSTNQGAYRLQRKNESFDTLLVTHYTTKDGLLSNGVHDLAIDNAFGMIWFGHEIGVSRYRKSDLREASKFMTDSAGASVIGYPIPFRIGQHARFTIDHIAENARVDIYNRGGSLIRSFSGSEVAGGKVEWDGFGKNGRLVAPGVYYYVVRTSSKKERGKFIVIH